MIANFISIVLPVMRIFCTSPMICIVPVLSTYEFWLSSITGLVGVQVTVQLVKARDTVEEEVGAFAEVPSQ